MGTSKYVKQTTQESERPDLGNARVVITGGRALKSAENFKMLEKLAEKLGAAGSSLEFSFFLTFPFFIYIFVLWERNSRTCWWEKNRQCCSLKPNRHFLNWKFGNFKFLSLPYLIIGIVQCSQSNQYDIWFDINIQLRYTYILIFNFFLQLVLLVLLLMLDMCLMISR